MVFAQEILDEILKCYKLLDSENPNSDGGGQTDNCFYHRRLTLSSEKSKILIIERREIDKRGARLGHQSYSF